MLLFFCGMKAHLPIWAVCKILKCTYSAGLILLMHTKSLLSIKIMQLPQTTGTALRREGTVRGQCKCSVFLLKSSSSFNSHVHLSVLSNTTFYKWNSITLLPKAGMVVEVPSSPLAWFLPFPAHLHLSSSVRQFKLGHILSPVSLGPSFCSVALKSARLGHGLLLSDPVPPSISLSSLSSLSPALSSGSYPFSPCHFLVSPWQEPTTDVGWDMCDTNGEMLRSTQLPRGEEGSSRFI